MLRKYLSLMQFLAIALDDLSPHSSASNATFSNLTCYLVDPHTVSWTNNWDEYGINDQGVIG